MGQKDSRPSNDSMSSSSSSSISLTGPKYGARQNEGLLTSALLIPQSAKMSKVKKAPLIHQCTDCEYNTKIKRELQRHRVLHDEKSAHQCPWCSFSVSYMPRLAVHVKYYHTKTDKKSLTATEKQSNSVGKTRAEEWYYSPSGWRKRYKLCLDCEYKTTVKENLDMHIKLMHPFSTTAPQFFTLKNDKHKFNCAHCPYKAKQRSELEQHHACHGNKSSKHHCHLCNYSVNNRGRLALHLKLHYREMDENNVGDQLNKEKDRDNNSTSRTSRNNRRSLLSCRDCHLFKTTSRFTLKRHVKRAHPFSLSALPPLWKEHQRNSHHLRKSGLKKSSQIPLQKKANNDSFKCLECDYSTSVTTNMNAHKKSHQHNVNVPETPARIQEVPLEARLRKQFGIKECRVTLHDIQPLSAKLVTPENIEQLPPNQEDDQITEVPNLENAEQLPPSDEEGGQIEDENEGQQEVNGKIQLLEIRIRSTDERVRIVDEEVKQITSKKMDVQKKIEDMAERRALILYNLLLEQRNLLEMQLAAHDAGEEPSEILKQSMEEEVKSLEDERDVVEGELQALKEEAKSLDQNLEEAQGSHVGIVQVLKALQSELDGLLLNIGV